MSKSVCKKTKGSGINKYKITVLLFAFIIPFCKRIPNSYINNNILVFQILAQQKHYINTLNTRTKCYKDSINRNAKSVKTSEGEVNVKIDTNVEI